MNNEDEHPDEGTEPRPAGTAMSNGIAGLAPRMNALNSIFRSDYFKRTGAFDAMFKPGGAWATAISGGLSGSVVSPETLKFFSNQMQAALPSADAVLIKNVQESLRSISKNFAAGAALNYANYRPPPAERRTAYSAEMTSPSDYFGPWEGVIESFSDLQAAVTRIFHNHPGTTFLWRGQQHAAWPLHSSLFRCVWKAKGVRDPSQPHRSSEPFPTDQDMREAENRILSVIREQWGFEDTSALSTFARLQHFGAPTRLLDVSRNPLIAAWFATEKDSKDEVEEADSRLFALAATRVAATPEQAHNDTRVSRIDLETAAAFNPFWDVDVTADGSDDTGFGEWGTGRIRRFWIPPHYETRIAAQNAAFILDGVPVESPDLSKYYAKGRGQEGVWTLADRLAASSISVRFSNSLRGAGSRIAATLPPSFTFRITGEAKRQIRTELEERYSYNKSTIYPDIQGAAQAIRHDPDLFDNL